MFAWSVAGAGPYGVFPNQPQLYATQGPPPPAYDQTLTHPMVSLALLRIFQITHRNVMWNSHFPISLFKMYQPMYGQGYPGGYLAGYPTAYGPLQYYPPLAAAAAYYPAAAMQPAPVRPTIMVPVSRPQYLYCRHTNEPPLVAKKGEYLERFSRLFWSLTTEMICALKWVQRQNMTARGELSAARY